MTFILQRGLPVFTHGSFVFPSLNSLNRVLLLPSGTLGRRLKATTKHRVSVPRSPIVERLGPSTHMVFDSCIYFQFSQQTVRKVGLVASAPARFRASSSLPHTCWRVPFICPACRLSATFFRLNSWRPCLPMLYRRRMLGEEAWGRALQTHTHEQAYYYIDVCEWMCILLCSDVHVYILM